MLPDLVDAGAEGVLVAGVVDDDGGDGAPLLGIGLRANAVGGLLPTETPGLEPLQADVVRRLDDDHRLVQPGHVQLDEQRHVVDDDVVLPRRVEQLLGPLPDLRVRDALEGPALVGVVEDDLRQRRPVQRAVLAQHALPELLDHLAEPLGAGRHHLTGQRVGVDHDRPVLGQEPCHRALARADTAGQPDLVHPTMKSGGSDARVPHGGQCLDPLRDVQCGPRPLREVAADAVGDEGELLRIEAGCGDRAAGEHGPHGHHRLVAGDVAEHAGAGQRAVQRHAEAVDVGQPGGRTPAEHHRVDVLHRLHPADAGDRHARLQHLRQAEVGEAPAVIGEQHVVRVDVAVHDPGLVQVVSGPGCTGDGPQRLGLVDRLRRSGERALRQPLHRVEERAALLPGVEQADEERRADGRKGLQLTGGAPKVSAVV